MNKITEKIILKTNFLYAHDNNTKVGIEQKICPFGTGTL